MQYKLYGATKSLSVRKCLAVAQQTSARLTVVNKTANEKKTSRVISAFDVYPVLVTARGTISGSNAICQFLATARPSEGLAGDYFGCAQAAGFLNTLSNELETAVYRKQTLNDDSAVKTIADFLSKLEVHFTRNTYAVEERRSFADVAASVVVKQASAFSPIGVSTKRWLDTITADPKVKPVSAKAASPKKKRTSAKEDTVEVPAVPAAVVTAPTPVVVEIDMGHPSLKPLNLADFPTPAAPADSEFQIDSWKREYSNSKDLYGEAMPWFFENIDAAGYSLWKMVYDKVEGECLKDYLTSNLVNGFLQRMDPAARKNGFGVCNVLGEEGNYNYEAVFLFRGADMPQYMIDHPSFEYHKFAKLDLTNDDHKKIISDMWCAEDMINGKNIKDCKQFK